MNPVKTKLRNARLRWWHAALFVAAFAVTIFAELPARWVAPAVAHATDGHVRVVATTGSSWAGHGDVVLRVEGGEIVFTGASWRWLPERLFARELALKVHLSGTATGDVVIARRLAGLVLRNAEVVLPMEALADAVAPLRSWRPRGTLVFRTDTLDLGPRGAAGGVELVWQNASTAMSPLGDFRCLLRAVPGSAAQVTVATLRGPLQLTAAGELREGGALRLRGSASSEPAYRDSLGPVLHAFGDHRGDGAVAFDIVVAPLRPA